MASLEELVKDGKIKLTLVAGPVRTASTIVANAMAQSPDIDIDQVCYQYGAKSLEWGVKKGVENLSSYPQHVIYVVDTDDCNDQLDKLVPLAEHVIFTTREPLNHSLALTENKTRRAERMTNIPSKDVLRSTVIDSDENWWANRAHQYAAGEKPDHAREGIEWCVNESADVMAKLVRSWGILKDQFACNYTNQPFPKCTYSVVDADLFRLAPELYLPELCKRSGIAESDNMIENWDGNIFTRGTQIMTTFNESDRIYHPTQETPCSDNLYQLFDYAPHVKSYVAMLNQSEFWPDFDDALAALQRKLTIPISPFRDNSGAVSTKFTIRHYGAKEDGQKEMVYDDMCPPTAYAYIATYPKAQADAAKQEAYLSKLRKRHPEHTPAFDAIDKAIEEVRAPDYKAFELSELKQHIPHSERVSHTAPASVGAWL